MTAPCSATPTWRCSVATAEGYAAYAAAVREEFAFVDDATFRAGRAAILRSLLDQPSIYRTAEGITRWEAAARRNVAAEIALLEAPSPS